MSPDPRPGVDPDPGAGTGGAPPGPHAGPCAGLPPAASPDDGEVRLASLARSWLWVSMGLLGLAALADVALGRPGVAPLVALKVLTVAGAAGLLSWTRRHPGPRPARRLVLGGAALAMVSGVSQDLYSRDPASLPMVAIGLGLLAAVLDPWSPGDQLRVLAILVTGVLAHGHALGELASAPVVTALLVCAATLLVSRSVDRQRQRAAERGARLGEEIRERERLETEMRALEHELLRESEREQRRIGRDLHDQLGQQLAAVSLLATSLHRSLADASPPARALAEKIQAAAGDATRSIRELARGLNPVVRGDPGEVGDDGGGGLTAALAKLAEGASVPGTLACRLEVEGRAPDLGAEVELQLYRIAQEALSNAIRHGRPAEVRIGLRARRGSVLLEVVDDGVGLPPGPPGPPGPATPSGGTGTGQGLRILRYRARRIGGDLSLGPGPGGRGTAVRCTVRSRGVPRDPSPSPVSGAQGGAGAG